MVKSTTSWNVSCRALRGGLALLAGLLLLALPALANSSDNGYGFELKEVSTGDKLDQTTLTTDKPLVVLVFSPHCPHCQRHMPYFAGFFKKADPATVNVVAIAVDCSSDEAKEYAQSKSLEFPVLCAKGGKAGDAFYKQGWPTTFVFAKGGNFVGTCDSTGPSYINDMLALVDKAGRQ